MTDFMPEGYEEPRSKSAGSYFKVNDPTLSEETKRIRIMGSFNKPHTAIMGWEVWTEVLDDETGEMKRIPIRKENNTEGYDTQLEFDDPQHFWAIQIFNLETNEPQVWGITQRTIQRAIRSFADNPNWGDPSGYVIAVTRTGTGLKTKYTLMPEPPVAPPSDEIIKAMAEAKIDCREMFARDGKGEKPFGALSGEDDDGMPF